jgi:hypothetical protein
MHLRRLAVLLTSSGLVAAALAFAPAASAAEYLEVVGLSEFTDSSGTRHIFGEIVNHGSSPVAVQADVTYRDQSGEVAGGDVGAPLLTFVAPNDGRTPFEVQPQQDYAGFDVAASPAASSAVFNHAFEVTKVGDFVDPATKARQIAMQVRNTNGGAAQDVVVAVTYYTQSGRVAGAETFGVGSLAGGATGRVEVPVNPEFPGVSSWQAVAESPTAPTGAGTEPPPASGSGSDKPSALVCNPAMKLSKKTVDVGSTTSVSVSGATPGSTLMLEGYSRPSTTYAPIRKGVTVGADGTVAPFAVRPPTSARVRIGVSGCAGAGAGQVISVVPGLGIGVTRVRTRTYTFTGKILPGKQNTGRAIALSVNGAKRTTVKSAADGSYKATLTLPRGVTKAWWATGADMTNLAGKSATKAFSVS